MNGFARPSLIRAPGPPRLARIVRVATRAFGVVAANPDRPWPAIVAELVVVGLCWPFDRSWSKRRLATNESASRTARSGLLGPERLCDAAAGFRRSEVRFRGHRRSASHHSRS